MSGRKKDSDAIGNKGGKATSTSIKTSENDVHPKNDVQSDNDVKPDNGQKNGEKITQSKKGAETRIKTSHGDAQGNIHVHGQKVGETEIDNPDYKDDPGHEDMETEMSSSNERENPSPKKDDPYTKKRRTNPQPCDDTSHEAGSRDSRGGVQQQAMLQMQRAAEASKQMLYGVYGNVVSILEEYEARTQKIDAERSKIALPDQSKKTVDDVQSIVQTQLLLFETQQRACPKDVSASVNKELRKKTIQWATVREERKMPMNETDKYICQLYEVLVKGKTKHDFLHKPREQASAETIRENVQHIFKGKHDAQEIDQQFKHDDKKEGDKPRNAPA